MPKKHSTPKEPTKIPAKKTPGDTTSNPGFDGGMGNPPLPPVPGGAGWVWPQKIVNRDGIVGPDDPNNWHIGDPIH